MKDLGKIIQAISFAYCLAMAVFMFTGPGRISAGLFLMMVGVAGFGFGRFFQSMGEHPIAPLSPPAATPPRLPPVASRFFGGNNDVELRR